MFLKKRLFPEILFLFLISGVVYLPQVGNLTYYTDDWYYIYDSMVGGAKIFHEMFRIDRPARGYFFELYFSLIGNNPLPYHIGIYLWHGLSAIGALWIFDILWRDKQRFNFITALLFVIYPGYFWWISAIEYQPMMASLALQVFSIAFTLKAFQSSRHVIKIIFLLGAILTGWVYIALVDYAIGMEGFRFLCVYLLVGRNSSLSFWNKLISTLKVWSWNFLIPAGFIIWRTFFFVNERKATDVGIQLSVFIERPVGTTLEWIFRLYDSLLNLSLLAWVNQFPSYLQGLRLRDTTIGLLFVAFALILFFLADRLIKKSVNLNNQDENRAKFGNEPFLLGGLGMLFGTLPTIIANRYINIEGFSHYALPVSLAAALFMTAFIESLSNQKIRTTVLYIIIGFATLSHYGIAHKAVTAESALKNFWWQMTWRAPSIRAETTLVIHYPIPGMEGDGYGLMEIANVIYFPEPTDQVPVKYPLAGITPNDQNLPDILTGTPFVQRTYRSHTVDFNYSNLLVITQPTTGSCVHVIDGNQPLISPYDPVNVIFIAPSSKIDNVITSVEPVTPINYIFGDEPVHDWCYFFQKADLAAQLGDWEKVISLSDEAFRLELSPEDRSEWLPFLKAYAITGNVVQLKGVSKRIVGDKFLRQESCKWLSEIDQTLTDEVKQVIDEYYCKSG